MIVIKKGLPEEFLDDAVELFWQAFQGKLHRVLYPEQLAKNWLRSALRMDNCFVAFAERQLIGIAGLHGRQGGFVDGGVPTLMRSYGWFGGAWRALAMMPLEGKAQPDVLIVDGLCVAERWQGAGVGTAMIAELVLYARAERFRRVSLEVINSNIGAIRFYEKHGFQRVAERHLGILGRLYSIHASIQMSRNIL